MVHSCNPSYLGGWGRKIAGTQEVEAVESWDYTIALQPGQQSKTLSQKQKTKQNKKDGKGPNSIIIYCEVLSFDSEGESHSSFQPGNNKI